MNNGTYNKNFQLTKNKFNSQENKISTSTKEKIDDFEIKIKSPLMYNRNNHPKYKLNTKGANLEEKIKKVNAIENNKDVKINNEINLNKKLNTESSKVNDLSTPEKITENAYLNKINNANDNFELQKKILLLEKEIKQLKIRTYEQDKIIEDKNNKIAKCEDENEKLKIENKKLKEKIERLETRINKDHQNNRAHNLNSGFDNYYTNEEYDYNPLENARQLRISRMMEILNNMNHIFHHQQDDDYLIDQIYPNPDNMTYEQLLELEEKMGYVSRGLTTEQIKSIPEITYHKNSPLLKNKNIGTQCTICQYDYTDGEKLKKLKCNHSYHTNCAEEWLQNNKSCPICKEEVQV